MRVFCNGFNLYSQLGGESEEPLFKTFAETSFNDRNVEEIEINQSYSVVRFDGTEVGFFCKEGYIRAPLNCNDLIQISSNNDRTLLLFKESRIYKIELSDLRRFTQIPNVLQDKTGEIQRISCGQKLTVFYTNLGHLYNFPNKLRFQSKGIVDIKTGREHCLLLDREGNIYSFGRGSRGQLGHGTLNDEEEPQLLEALAGIKIAQIATGDWHSCALSSEGDLYTWGWNSNGQLGVLDEGKSPASVLASPHVVDFEKSTKNAKKVACGSRHTVVLLDDNSLQGCGWNKYKQLLNVKEENLYSLTYLHRFSDEIVGVQCGPWNSIVFL